MFCASRASALLAVALSLLAVAGCGDESESDRVFDREGFPFTFEYPDDFEETEDVSIDQPLGEQPDESVAVGLEDNDVILLQRVTLRIAINRSNIELAKREFDRLIQAADPGASAEVSELAGLPALAIDDVAVPSVEGGESRITIVFDGDQEYVINCQSTPDHRTEIDDACETALETLKFE